MVGLAVNVYLLLYYDRSLARILSSLVNLLANGRNYFLTRLLRAEINFRKDLDLRVPTVWAVENNND